ncbi:MAG: glycoside hydrolase family 65 protein [Chloroflexota bacterium]|nr:MAG: glycoside hydrolase family 65 protein [Chloroflexota bacterium]
MNLWTIQEADFTPATQHHKETIFTTGNGYLATRGTFEEGFPNDRRATFLHGVFDAAPLVVTELANAPDWLPFEIFLNGERFALDRGSVISFERALDLRNGVLTRRVEWESPRGERAAIVFERFASLAALHALFLRVRVTPQHASEIHVRAGLNGTPISEGSQGERLLHWNWQGQGARDGNVFLQARTFHSDIELGAAMRVTTTLGNEVAREFWDVRGEPTLALRVNAGAGETVMFEKTVSYYTSRDVEKARVVECALQELDAHKNWASAYQANADAWQEEWERTDVVIEGDEEAQLALRFNLFQMLIAAPRHDDRVNIGAKTLSGFGYRGHAFWDTEIFMLPLFIYTAPHIAKNLLNYRYRLLDAARAKAKQNGFEGAQFPWESADTGEEVTPTWLPHYADRTKLIRIWTGDIEIHISADIAYAAHQYWVATGDYEWLIAKGAELILDTAKFWAARAEWNNANARYEYNDVIGPDEYHEHVNNNYYTNRLAQWNLQTAFDTLNWLNEHAPKKARELEARLGLNAARLDKWRDVIAKMYLPALPNGLLLQFQDYLQRTDVDLAALEPRTISVQQHFGIEGTNETQVLKQPDVLMLMYLLQNNFSEKQVRLNYDFYTPRTDHTFGSSLGPSIQAIMACKVGKPDDAYEHFIRALRADLYDVRGNAHDGIHGASAGGTWQAVVFGFGGLRVTKEGWSIEPRLPHHWTRLQFRFFYHGKQEIVEIVADGG